MRAVQRCRINTPPSPSSRRSLLRPRFTSRNILTSSPSSCDSRSIVPPLLSRKPPEPFVAPLSTTPLCVALQKTEFDTCAELCSKFPHAKQGRRSAVCEPSPPVPTRRCLAGRVDPEQRRGVRWPCLRPRPEDHGPRPRADECDCSVADRQQRFQHTLPSYGILRLIVLTSTPTLDASVPTSFPR